MKAIYGGICWRRAYFNFSILSITSFFLPLNQKHKDIKAISAKIKIKIHINLILGKFQYKTIWDIAKTPKVTAKVIQIVS